jgi:hypothetical protein
MRARSDPIQTDKTDFTRPLDYLRGPLPHTGLMPVIVNTAHYPSLRGRTGSIPWNKVRCQQEPTTRAARRNRTDSGVVRL